jgi:hypothetical protein
LSTDGRTDRHGETSIPTYNFVAGGIIIGIGNRLGNKNVLTELSDACH